MSFSPHYDTYTLSVMQEYSDTARSWKRPNTSKNLRMHNIAALCPGIGGIIGTYRIVAGLADFIFANCSFQRTTGYKNISFGIIQILPTALIYKALTSIDPQPYASLILPAIGLTLLFSATLLFMAGHSHPHNAATALIYDDWVAYTYNPRGSNYCSAEQWIHQIIKYGIPTSKFV